MTRRSTVRVDERRPRSLAAIALGLLAVGLGIALLCAPMLDAVGLAIIHSATLIASPPTA